MRDPNTSRGMRLRLDPRLPERVVFHGPDEQGRTSWTTATDQFPAQRPLSTVLWDFAAPVLGPPEDWEPDRVHLDLEFAGEIWNAVVLEQHRRNPRVLLTLRLAAARLDTERTGAVLRLIEELRRSKLERFGPDARLIIEQVLTREDSVYHLRVSSSDLDQI